jgi:serine/threonine-protein kinase
MTDLYAEHLTTVLRDRYRIERVLGSGGMATVYLARDLRHERDVAIKVLRPELARAIGSERFLQEIHVTARLHHPHIVPLYDSGEAGGFLYYVMPLMQGESLRDRLRRERRLPYEEAIRIATEVADALDYAHAQGVLHRDIKPENILLEGRHAAVSDFGIARAVSAAGAHRLTATGIAVGTPNYMSPEQAAGETELDSRSDIYSLGCVLYEMLAGEAPLVGPTMSVTLARRLRDPVPPLSSVVSDVPPELDLVLATALASSPEERYTTAGDFAAALRSGPAARIEPAQRRSKPAILVAGLVALGLAAFAAFELGSMRDASSETVIAGGPVRTLAQVTFRSGVEEWPAWSGDGTQLVFAAEAGGSRKLFIKRMETDDERQVTTSERDEIQPTWSPDGKRLAFVRASEASTRFEPSDVYGWYGEGGEIWTRDLETGREERVVRDAFHPSYSPDGARLAFDARWSGPRRIWMTDGGGRNPQQITNDSSEAVVHCAPRWSPDGRLIVFRRVQQAKSDIVVVDVVSKAMVRVTDDHIFDLNPTWGPHPLSRPPFGRGGTKNAIYFSSARGGGFNVWRVPVSSTGEPTGPGEQLTTGAGDDLEVAVAPDGRVAFAVVAFDSDLWRLAVDPRSGRALGQPERLVGTTRVESRGSWSPDGRMIAFNSDRLGEMNLWLRSISPRGAAPGSAERVDRRITSGAGGDYQPNWSPDGKQLVFFSARSGNNDIWTIRLSDGKLERLTHSPGIDINPFYSPDGKRIAFHSDRDGRTEVWLMNADGTEQRRVTSVGVGGHFMRWSPDGRWVYFRAEGPAAVMRVELESGAIERLPEIVSGAHISFSPARDLVLDARGHKALWVFPLNGSPAREVLGFDDPEIRVDYPVWSPDGRWVLFDRVVPRGGDIWILNGAR